MEMGQLKLSSKPQFEDGRGKIVDLLVGEQLDSVTYITFTEGAVRANHYHKQTIQWTFVTKGSLIYSSQVPGCDPVELTISKGDLVVSYPGESHAFLALEEADILVFTKGPRAGFDYEKDTFRLEVPLLVGGAK